MTNLVTKAQCSFTDRYALKKRKTINISEFEFRNYNEDTDFNVINQWLSLSYSKYWGMNDLSTKARKAELKNTDHKFGLVGIKHGKILFYTELYHPEKDEIGGHYPVHEGDCGMHLIIAPVDIPEHGLSQKVITAISSLILEHLSFTRLVVEPDINNEKVHRLNHSVGIEYSQIVPLISKTAKLGFATKYQFLQSQGKVSPMKNSNKKPSLSLATSHLTAEYWQKANQHLIAKMITELSHEQIITPQKLDDESNTEVASWHITFNLDSGTSEYLFRARQYQLDHLLVEPQSICCTKDDKPQPLDAISFILSCRHLLEITDALLPTYLEEITSTLYSKAYKLMHQHKTADQLATASYQEIEAAMTEGHPVFIANNGRIGFDMLDHVEFSPESGQPLNLQWIAVLREKTSFAAIESLNYDTLIFDELGESQLNAFNQQLSLLGLEPSHYYLMPIHPWQWREKVSRIFAADIANQYLVPLGTTEDKYQAQQSIRTFFNLSSPEKCYVKTALSILNMGFMRGLSPYYMSRTPAINTFIANLIEDDPYFTKKQFFVLKEIAAIGYHHDYYEQATQTDSPYKKMLSSLWRESPYAPDQHGNVLVKKQQKLMTMAALLHIDDQGKSLISALMADSPLSDHQWLKQYMDLYLHPLLHSFFAYDLVFMPHGENLILVLEDNVPVKIIMKDIGEEVAILNGEKTLPSDMTCLAVELEEPMKLNYILLDIFDCIFRFIAPLLDQQTEVSESDFWEIVSNSVKDYQQEHPQFNAKYQRYDLYCSTFARTCLNRIQLNNNQQMIDLEDREKNLRFAEDIANPLALFAETHRIT